MDKCKNNGEWHTSCPRLFQAILGNQRDLKLEKFKFWVKIAGVVAYHLTGIFLLVVFIMILLNLIK